MPDRMNVTHHNCVANGKARRRCGLLFERLWLKDAPPHTLRKSCIVSPRHFGGRVIAELASPSIQLLCC